MEISRNHFDIAYTFMNQDLLEYLMIFLREIWEIGETLGLHDECEYYCLLGRWAV
jgi:hypothetical protein